MLVVGAVLLLGGAVALAILTGVGARRRGMPVLTASAAGLFFPATWVAWYVRDEHPYGHRRQHPRGRRGR